MSNMQKEFKLDNNDVAKFLRNIADALENESQLNVEFGEERLIQPLGSKIPLRVYQDDEGTEIGFKLANEKEK